MMRAGPGVAFAIFLALTVVSNQGRDGLKLAGALIVDAWKFRAKLQRNFAVYLDAPCRSEPDLANFEGVNAPSCFKGCFKDEQCNWVQFKRNAESWLGRCERFTECKEYPEDEADADAPVRCDPTMPRNANSRCHPPPTSDGILTILARRNFPEKKRLAFFIAPKGVQRMASECTPVNCEEPLKEFKNVKNWKKCMKKCTRIELCKHFEFFKRNKVCKLFKGVPALAFTGKNVKSGTRPGNDPRNDMSLPVYPITWSTSLDR